VSILARGHRARGDCGDNRLDGYIIIYIYLSTLRYSSIDRSILLSLVVYFIFGCVNPLFWHFATALEAIAVRITRMDTSLSIDMYIDIDIAL